MSRGHEIGAPGRLGSDTDLAKAHISNGFRWNACRGLFMPAQDQVAAAVRDLPQNSGETPSVEPSGKAAQNFPYLR